MPGVSVPPGVPVTPLIKNGGREHSVAGVGPPRRCLMLSRVGFLGGVERIALTLAGSLARHGWQATIACPEGGDLAAAARRSGVALAPSPFDRMRITADPRVLARYPLAWLD